MRRRLEPEVMDTEEDAAEYDAMDFSEPNGQFAEAALALCEGLAQPQVLDIGTGTARIPILMLQRSPRMSVLAIDLAGEMLQVAAQNLARHGLSSRCTLRRLDAKALEIDGSFDLVMSNSTAHHIPEPLDLFREIQRVASDRGAILVRDLIRPESEEEAWSIVERVSQGDSPRQRRLFFDSLCAALTLDEVEAAARAADLEGVVVSRVSDRHWSMQRPASRA
jgi:ubiquinone/menaquinone biosynthesis C-methylase UbiE